MAVGVRIFGEVLCYVNESFFDLAGFILYMDIIHSISSYALTLRPVGTLPQLQNISKTFLPKKDQ